MELAKNIYYPKPVATTGFLENFGHMAIRLRHKLVEAFTNPAYQNRLVGL